jgi:hypothetical protein
MKIPTFSNGQIVDKDGNCTPSFGQYNDQLNQQMQLNLSDNGTVIPGNTTVNITYFSSVSNPNAMPNGTVWYDTDTGQFKGLVDGVVKVFTLV